MKMFESEFQRHGISASDSDVEIYIENLMRETGSTRAQVEEALAKLGLQWSDYFERMRQELQRMALINREIRARVNVTPEEIQRHWQEDSAYMQPERREVGHIFIPLPERATAEQVEETKALAQRAYEAARDDFADAAAEYSSGPNADEGGILGTFREGEMAESFETAVADLQAGQVSPPFQAEGAFHILKLVRVVQPEREPLDDETREKIEEQLYNESLDTRFKRWVDEDLVKRHHITMQLDELDELVGQGRS
jgi:peptidyl-prolyl cis-trans isomerase SurA